MKVAFAVVLLLVLAGCTEAWFGGGGGSKSGGGGGSKSGGGGGSKSGNGGGSKGGNGGGSKSGDGNKEGKKGGTSVDVGVEASKDSGPSVSAGVSHLGDGWSADVKGTVDSDGNWEAKAGVSIELNKRSIHWNGLHYIVRVHADQCDFHVYDGNKDGTIVKNEIHAIFEDHTKAEELFDALDITTGDGRIEEDEFYFMSRVVIDGCDSMDKL